MNKTLYLKYRPKSFIDIIGQNEILKFIKNSLIYSKIHHSFLFEGNKGTGKTTIARLFVKSINCKNINKYLYNSNNDFPCNICRNCILINNNNFNDIIEVDSSFKNSIDDIKNLINSMEYLPIISKYKIYIIDEIHMLSKQAFSSILKSLEEPPYYVKFILITTEIKKIPDNIISRCIVLNFKNIDNNDIVKKLSYILNLENINYNINSLYKISNFSNGSIRDSINIIEKCILMNNNIIDDYIVNKILCIIDNRLLFNIIYYIFNNNIELLLKNINKIIQNIIINYNNVFIQIFNLIHNILMIKINGNYLLDNDFLDIKILINKYINIFSLKKINKIYKLFITKNDLIYNFNNKLGFEIMIINIFYEFNK